MSDLEGSNNSMTFEQEEINALMEEGFGNNPSTRASSSTSSSNGAASEDLPDLDIPNFPLLNPLRELLVTYFSLWWSRISTQNSLRYHRLRDRCHDLPRIYQPRCQSHVYFIYSYPSHPFPSQASASARSSLRRLFGLCLSSTYSNPPQRRKEHHAINRLVPS